MEGKKSLIVALFGSLLIGLALLYEMQVYDQTMTSLLNQIKQYETSRQQSMEQSLPTIVVIDSGEHDEQQAWSSLYDKQDIQRKREWQEIKRDWAFRMMRQKQEMRKLRQQAKRKNSKSSVEYNVNEFWTPPKESTNQQVIKPVDQTMHQAHQLTDFERNYVVCQELLAILMPLKELMSKESLKRIIDEQVDKLKELKLNHDEDAMKRSHRRVNLIHSLVFENLKQYMDPRNVRNVEHIVQFLKNINERKDADQKLLQTMNEYLWYYRISGNQKLLKELKDGRVKLKSNESSGFIETKYKLSEKVMEKFETKIKPVLEEQLNRLSAQRGDESSDQLDLIDNLNREKKALEHVEQLKQKYLETAKKNNRGSVKFTNNNVRDELNDVQQIQHHEPSFYDYEFNY